YARQIKEYKLAIQQYWKQYDSLLNAWRDERTKCLDEYALTAEKSGKADIAGLSSYAFNATRLGWINCDRFPQIADEQKYVAEVIDTDASREQVYLVFSDINSIVGMNPTGDGRYEFAGVPKGQITEVFALKVKDGRAMVCR